MITSGRCGTKCDKQRGGGEVRVAETKGLKIDASSGDSSLVL